MPRQAPKERGLRAVHKNPVQERIPGGIPYKEVIMGALIINHNSQAINTPSRTRGNTTGAHGARIGFRLHGPTLTGKQHSLVGPRGKQPVERQSCEPAEY